MSKTRDFPLKFYSNGSNYTSLTVLFKFLIKENVWFFRELETDSFKMSLGQLTVTPSHHTLAPSNSNTPPPPPNNVNLPQPSHESSYNTTNYLDPSRTKKRFSLDNIVSADFVTKSVFETTPRFGRLQNSSRYQVP